MTDGSRPDQRSVDLFGMVLVVTSAFCYAALGILGKVAYAEGLPLIPLLATRFTIGAAALWSCVLLVPGFRRAAGSLTPGEMVRLILWGVFGFAGQSALFFSALRLISASLTVVLLYTCPAFLALLVWARSGRRPASSRLLAIALVLFGTYLCVGGPGGAEAPLGMALGLMAGFWYAVFMIVLHRLAPSRPAVVTAALIITGAALVFDAAALVEGGFILPPTARAWGAVLGIVATATVFGLILYVVGLRRVGPQATSILSTFEPLGTLLLAGLFLGERLAATQWAGSTLIIGAAMVLAAVPDPHDASILPPTGPAMEPGPGV